MDINFTLDFKMPCKMPGSTKFVSSSIVNFLGPICNHSCKSAPERGSDSDDGIQS